MGFKSHIEKTWILSCEHKVYILMSFKSHIKRILCYYFKLKYLNQKVLICHFDFLFKTKFLNRHIKFIGLDKMFNYLIILNF